MSSRTASASLALASSSDSAPCDSAGGVGALVRRTLDAARANFFLPSSLGSAERARFVDDFRGVAFEGGPAFVDLLAPGSRFTVGLLDVPEEEGPDLSDVGSPLRVGLFRVPEENEWRMSEETEKECMDGGVPQPSTWREVYISARRCV